MLNPEDYDALKQQSPARRLVPKVKHTSKRKHYSRVAELYVKRKLQNRNAAQPTPIIALKKGAPFPDLLHHGW